MPQINDWVDESPNQPINDWTDEPQPQQAATPASPAFPTDEPQLSGRMGAGEDMLRSIGSGIERGPVGAAMLLPNVMNTAVAGPQFLYRGLTGRERDNSPVWQPFYSSEDVLQMAGVNPYNPQTIPGKITEFVISTLVGAGTAKGMQVGFPKAVDLLKDTSGVRPIKPNQPLPKGTENLSILPNAAKGTAFAKAPNPLKVGLEGNQKISAQYGVDKDLQASLYRDLNQKGSVMSIKHPDLYKKMDDLIGYLKDKVAIDTPEHRALTELTEIRDNLASKYSVSAVPQKTSPILNASGQPVVTPAQPGVAAYGIEPSDLIDIKTVLNSGLKVNKFTNAGSAKILAFKSYVQDGLNSASKISQDFGQSLIKAEKQAARVGQYKNPQLRQLWQPEDYVAWKAGNAPSSSTVGRASKFLETLNSKNAGRASALASVLSPKEAQAILRAAIVHGKKTTPNLPKAGFELATGHPFLAGRTAISSFTSPKSTPLVDLASQIKRLQKGKP